MSGESVISVKNIKTYFYSENRCNRAVNGVSFEVKRGRTLCVVGESGCGKSVTASSIMQLLPRLARIEEGEIIYHSEEQGDIDLSKLQRNGKEMRQLQRDMAKVSERLENRSMIEKAKGRIMQRDGFSEQEAYHYIRGLSLSKNISMRRVAEIVLLQTGG